MTTKFSSKLTKEQLETAVAHNDAASKDSVGIDQEAVVRGNHDSRGKFAIGNRAQPSGKGIVAFIKAETHDYHDLIKFLLKASRGEAFGKHVPTFKERLDATNSLLDRSIGKPTQQVLHTGDDVAKELLATRQEALRLQKAEVLRKAEERKQESAITRNPDTEDRNVSSLQAMRDQGSGGRGQDDVHQVQ